MDRSADGNGRTVNGQRPGKVIGDPNDQLLVVPVEVGDMSASLELWLPGSLGRHGHVEASPLCRAACQYVIDRLR